MFVHFASSETVNSICITYWTFFTLHFAYKVLLSAEFYNIMDILAIQVGIVSADTYVRLTEKLIDTLPDELSTGYSAVGELSNRKMNHSFRTKMIKHHLFNQMCHQLNQVHQLMKPVDPPMREMNHLLEMFAVLAQRV